MSQRLSAMDQLWGAVEAYNWSTVRSLIQRKSVDVNTLDKDGRTLLWWACMTGDEAMVEWLSSHGANVNAADTDGETPLYSACRWGHVNAAHALLLYGANVHAANNEAWTPLHVACFYGQLEVVQVLLSHGANVHLTNRNGWTPLHCSRRQLNVAKLLLSHGANVHDINNDGWTPLHCACRWGDLPVAQLLLSHGADKNAINKKGETPMIVAKSEGHTDVVQYMKTQANQSDDWPYTGENNDDENDKNWLKSRIFDYPNEVKTFDFFISHRGPDAKVTLAQPLHFILNKLRISSFVDTYEIEMGEPNEVEIARGLYGCRYGVVFISDNFLDSKWCQSELNTLYRRHRQERHQQDKGLFKLLAFFENQRIMKQPEYEPLTTIGASVRPPGISDRQYLLRNVVPKLISFMDTSSIETALLEELLDEYLAQENVVIPMSLRRPTSFEPKCTTTTPCPIVKGGLIDRVSLMEMQTFGRESSGAMLIRVQALETVWVGDKTALITGPCLAPRIALLEKVMGLDWGWKAKDQF